MVRSISAGERYRRTLHLRAGLQALHAARQNGQPIGAHQRGDHPGAARKRRSQQALAHPPDHHAHVIVIPGR